MAKDEELVTVGQYAEPMEAEMAKGRLDAAGIPYFLVGENAALLYGTGLGGLMLQVSPKDEADARSALEPPEEPPANPKEALREATESEQDPG